MRYDVSDGPVLPPYAAKLARARARGMVPVCDTGFFWIALGWEAYRAIRDNEGCPAIVIPLDRPLSDFDLSPVAGLNVAVLYEPHDVGWVDDVLEALMSFRLGRVMTVSTHALQGLSQGVDHYDWKVVDPWPGGGVS